MLSLFQTINFIKCTVMEAEQALLCVLASRRISVTRFVHVAHWFMAVSSMRLSVFINLKKESIFFKNSCQTKTNKHFLSPLFSRSDTMSARAWI